MGNKKICFYVQEILVSMINNPLATSYGIGGENTLSSMILGVEEFEPSRAFPIVNFSILLWGLNTLTYFALAKLISKNFLFIMK